MAQEIIRTVVGEGPDRYELRSGELLLATEADRLSDDVRREQNLVRFTVYTADPDGEPSEELDIDAKTSHAARRLALHILRKEYMPGLGITGVEERFGLYM